MSLIMRSEIGNVGLWVSFVFPAANSVFVIADCMRNGYKGPFPLT
jgi:hypothetical protein